MATAKFYPTPNKQTKKQSDLFKKAMAETITGDPTYDDRVNGYTKTAKTAEQKASTDSSKADALLFHNAGTKSKDTPSSAIPDKFKQRSKNTNNSNSNSNNGNNQRNTSPLILSDNDYLRRKAKIAKANTVAKVSLVGRTQAGHAYSGTSVLGSIASPSDASHKALSMRNNKLKNKFKTTHVKTEMSVVTFDVSPEISESGQTITTDISNMRSASGIVIYMGTPGRNFSINASLISRTATEADENLYRLNVLRAWREPVSALDEPETVRLYAYNNNIKGIPLILQSISINYPIDVDYISATNGEKVPIIQTVSLGFKEVRTIDDIFAFDYQKFKDGTLDGW